MENIIRKSIEGGWTVGEKYRMVDNPKIKGWWYEWDSEDENGDPIVLSNPCCYDHIKYQYPLVLNPLFWQALGKACGWNDENKFRMMGGVAHKINMETGKYIPIWIYHAIKFHEINLTQGWDKAVEYLEDLIK